ncbi:hypothetical protein HYC85_023939 [Camellia sinensis]|uniref:Serine hydroxymethyltransferase-like domain-containing protein n=1 Tax=Camellia sinensis TaxID=4442 RepID=A0A7J7GFZ6_CAMSI|nr:hypothetical protein HYC85_023939 [Camellia sinensis]
MRAVGSVMINMCSEGYPGATRYYGGNEYIDMAEWGDNATHRLDESTGYIDYDRLEKSATLFRPKLFVAGASAYARLYDYACIRKVCDKQKAILLADIAHISGLVAAGVIPSPFEFADIVTTTTHKSLCGPRGAMIFFKKGVKEIDKQGQEVMYDYEDKSIKLSFLDFKVVHTITLFLAMTSEDKAYQVQVLSNCSKFAETLLEKGYDLVSGGTDNHLVLVNLRNMIVIYKVLLALELTRFWNQCTLQNTVPGDAFDMVPGGTPALTSRGFAEEDFVKVVEFFDAAVKLALTIKADTKGS